MLRSSVPTPDLIIESTTPTNAFAPPLVDAEAEQAIGHLNSETANAQQRLSDGFQFEFDDLPSLPTQLDNVISEMWATGWDPDSSSLDQFVTDFGLIFLDALRSMPGATPVMRSATDLNHASVWFGVLGAEAFPFHKTLKALVSSEGESLRQMYDSICELNDG